MAKISNLSIKTISHHIKKVEENGSVFSYGEITETIGADGKTYKTKLYNLDMIEAISKRSKSNSGDEFIEWANDILKSNNNLSIAKFSPNEAIKSKIHQIRGVQVMLDFDLVNFMDMIQNHSINKFKETSKNFRVISCFN